MSLASRTNQPLAFPTMPSSPKEVQMATMLAPPTLSISGSSTVGRSDLTVSYVVLFDALDVNTDQTYHAHATVVDVDPNHYDVILEWGSVAYHAGMALL